MLKSIVKMTAAALLGATALAGASVAQDAPASSLSELLQRIQRDSSDTSAEARQREAEFQQRRDQQAALLAQARGRLAGLEAEKNQMEARFQENDRLVGELQQQLVERQGEFGELFGVARQAAGDTRALLDASIISAQYTDRTADLAAVAETQRLPSRDQLDAIWKTRIQEMVAQREVVTFQARVQNFNSDGTAAEVDVTRIGPFVVYASQGGVRFVDYAGGQLEALARQPAPRILAGAAAVSNGSPERLVAGPIDPARGDLLTLVVDTPTFAERVDQGGQVGYVTLGLAAVGVAFGLIRLVMLMLQGLAVRAQAGRSTPSKSNRLGRIMLAAEGARGADAETFALKLDDAILREAAGLDFGLNFLKLAAGVAPLLGLLGTVTGMILTFQQITLFGTGDPKIMAGGISQALVTTVIGLVAAIPLLFIHSLCASASRSVQQVLEEQSAGIIAEHAGKKR